MGLSGRPDAELLAWVTASCLAQGVPPTISDPAVIRDVVALLGGPVGRPRAQARSASTRTIAGRSQPPRRDHAVDVEGSGPGCAGQDGGVVQDCADDGVLATQVLRVPRSA